MIIFYIILAIMNLLMTLVVLCTNVVIFGTLNDWVKVWKEILKALEKSNGNN